MEFRLSAEEEAFRAEIRAWLRDNLPAGLGTPAYREPRTAEEKIAASKAWQATLHRGGWAGITWPQAYGGRGPTLVEQLIFNEECAAANAPDSINLSVALGLVGPTLMACGTPEQQARFLPRILRGDDIWCQGFSEPNAGSDLAGLKTRGDVEGDAIVVTGQKIWTSFANIAEFQELLVRTDPEAPKHKGITWVICPMDAKGIDIRLVAFRECLARKDFSIHDCVLVQSAVPSREHVGHAGPGRDDAPRIGGRRERLGEVGRQVCSPGHQIRNADSTAMYTSTASTSPE